MELAICTISSKKHAVKAKALFRSLEPFSCDLFHLVIDDKEKESNPKVQKLSLEELQGETANRLVKKYKGDKLRWSCKPLLLKHLLQKGYKKVLYLDNDTFFFNSPQFLFDGLDQNNILLSPHFYKANPNNEQYWLEANYRVGLYNAGFIGVNKSAIEALQWWADCCLYNVKKAFWRGLFDDQKYLDLFPILFDKVDILKHKGCNVAGWNIEICSRSLNENNELILGGKWPLVFIHFNGYTVRSIIKGQDPLLKPFLDSYFKTLLELNPDHQNNLHTQYTIWDGWNYLRHFTWKLARKFD